MHRTSTSWILHDIGGVFDPSDFDEPRLLPDGMARALPREMRCSGPHTSRRDVLSPTLRLSAWTAQGAEARVVEAQPMCARPEASWTRNMAPGGAQPSACVGGSQALCPWPTRWQLRHCASSIERAHTREHSLDALISRPTDRYRWSVDEHSRLYAAKEAARSLITP